MAKHTIHVGPRARGKAGMTITVDDTDVHLKFNRFAQRLSDFRRFWVEYFAPKFFADIQSNFASSGKYVGGWRSLSPKYAAWKLARYGRLPILVLTGDMRESLRFGGRNNYVRATKRWADFGSRDPKVAWHNRGMGRLPRRQVLFIKKDTIYQRLLNRYVREEMQAAGIRAA